VGTQIDWLCADFEASLHRPDAAQIGGDARVGEVLD
jgi:hypothetical protein